MYLHRDKDTQKEDTHMAKEEEIGVMRLQATNCPGLWAASRI